MADTAIAFDAKGASLGSVSLNNVGFEDLMLRMEAEGDLCEFPYAASSSGSHSAMPSRRTRPSVRSALLEHCRNLPGAATDLASSGPAGMPANAATSAATKALSPFGLPAAGVAPFPSGGDGGGINGCRSKSVPGLGAFAGAARVRSPPAKTVHAVDTALSAADFAGKMPELPAPVPGQPHAHPSGPQTLYRAVASMPATPVRSGGADGSAPVMLRANGSMRLAAHGSAPVDGLRSAFAAAPASRLRSTLTTTIVQGILSHAQIAPYTEAPDPETLMKLQKSSSSLASLSSEISRLNRSHSHDMLKERPAAGSTSTSERRDDRRAGKGLPSASNSPRPWQPSLSSAVADDADDARSSASGCVVAGLFEHLGEPGPHTRRSNSSGTFRSVASILSDRGPEATAEDMKHLRWSSLTPLGAYPFGPPDDEAKALRSTAGTRGSVVQALRSAHGPTADNLDHDDLQLACPRGKSKDYLLVASDEDSAGCHSAITTDGSGKIAETMPLTARSLELLGENHCSRTTTQAFWNRFWSKPAPIAEGIPPTPDASCALGVGDGVLNADVAGPSASRLVKTLSQRQQVTAGHPDAHALHQPDAGVASVQDATLDATSDVAEQQRGQRKLVAQNLHGLGPCTASVAGGWDAAAAPQARSNTASETWADAIDMASEPMDAAAPSLVVQSAGSSVPSSRVC